MPRRTVAGATRANPLEFTIGDTPVKVWMRPVANRPTLKRLDLERNASFWDHAAKDANLAEMVINAAVQAGFEEADATVAVDSLVIGTIAD